MPPDEHCRRGKLDAAATWLLTARLPKIAAVFVKVQDHQPVAGCRRHTQNPDYFRGNLIALPDAEAKAAED